MQFAKDTFYITLRDRLAALNPARTVLLDGQTRPAVVVLENEPVTIADPPLPVPAFAGAPGPRPRAPLPGAFFLHWGAPRAVNGAAAGPRPLLALECTVAFRTSGSTDAAGVDRGRAFAQLQSELLQICSPPQAPKRDYTGASPAELGSNVAWTRLAFQPPQAAAGELSGAAVVTVFFFPEVDC